MKRILVILALAISAPSFILGQATREKRGSSTSFKATPSDEMASADGAAIRKLQDDIEAAFNAADLESLMSYDTENVIYLIPGKPAIEGRQAVRDNYRAVFDGWARRGVSAKLVTRLHEVVVAGDWAFARGQSTFTVTPKDGGTPTQVLASSSRSIGGSRTVRGKGAARSATAIAPRTTFEA